MKLRALATVAAVAMVMAVLAPAMPREAASSGLSPAALILCAGPSSGNLPATLWLTVRQSDAGIHLVVPCAVSAGLCPVASSWWRSGLVQASFDRAGQYGCSIPALQRQLLI